MTTIMNIGPETITLLMVNSRGRQICSGKQIPESEPTATLMQNHNLFNANLVSKIGFVKNEYGCQKRSFTSYSYSRILVYTAFPQTTGPLFTSSAIWSYFCMKPPCLLMWSSIPFKHFVTALCCQYYKIQFGWDSNSHVLTVTEM